MSTLHSHVKDQSSYKEMQSVRRELPAWAQQQNILQLLSENQVLVISGMTGLARLRNVYLQVTIERKLYCMLV